ncbi:MAG: hypothetical protein KAT68_16720 [Bacteroidales bacterium]|nr:hypothetical protein [Bacteroidales bacterium]
MQKYSFLVYHKEYGTFLQDLQQLGVLHVIEKKTEISESIKEKYRLLNRYNKTIDFLEKLETEQDEQILDAEGFEILEEISQKQDKLENLKQELIANNKELKKVEPWGDFSKQIISKLQEENILVRFFIASNKKFNPERLSKYFTEIIYESGNNVYFIIIQKEGEKINIDAEEIKLPERSFSEINNNIQEIEEEISIINNDFDNYAKTSIPLLNKTRAIISGKSEYERVVYNTTVEADEKLMILEGWVPNTKKKQTEDFLNNNNILYIANKPKNEDKVPILLKNNQFTKLFEPIGKLFSLPSYAELDLTAFFAPFFMMFFGFCLGDAGYGLLFIVGATIYKLKAKKEIKPYLSLIQFLGIATVIFGVISGTLFGINLIETEIELFADYKNMFLNADNMFKLALVLGGIQIIFGMFIKAINQIRQYGFVYSLATFGWLILLLGGTVYLVLSKKGIIVENNILLYVILSLGGFFILFFSDPEISVLARIGKGIWDVYSTVTGIFGDLLSYIRLFALGLSSAILGFVINDIGMQILGSAPIIGPVFFVIFLIFGHTLNILISSLGSFVHPMRLTFVEFYKNAGFAGGGKEYKPFSK